jgi:hypothetical protein
MYGHLQLESFFSQNSVSVLLFAELGQVLSDFGKSVKLLGNCEGGSLGKAFADLGGCADQLSFKLQNKVGSPTITYCYKWLQSLQTFLWLSAMTVPVVLYGGSLSSMTVIADNRKGDLFHGLVF